MSSEPRTSMPPSAGLPPARGDGVAMVVFACLGILLCLALALEAPGVLILLLILATPAWIRTLIALSRQRAAGAPPSGPVVVGTFLSSLGVVVLTAVASVAAFFATCFAVCLGGLALSNKKSNYDMVMIAAVGAGLVPGIAIAVFLFRLFWRRKAPRQSLPGPGNDPPGGTA